MPRRILNGTSLSDRIIATNLAAGDFARSLLGDGNDVFEGSAGGDQASGEAGNDALYGRDGNDTLTGGAGIDTLDGGEGDDSLDGGADNDILDGGNGNDILRGGSGSNRIRAGAGNDSVTAGDDGDMIWGDDGNDTINAGGGGNFVYAGAGDDRVTAGDVGDMIWGDEGSDTINAGGGNNWVSGGEGNDSITAGDIGDFLYGDAGDDTINAGGGNNWVSGGEGHDQIRGGMDNDMLYGEAGDDVITDGGGHNFAYGGAGNDRITTGEGNDFAYGDEGQDTIQLGQGNNVGYGGIGNDSLTAGGGMDQLYGEDGDDTLNAGAGLDLVLGGAGNDLVLQGRNDGAQGQDYLRGGVGTDTLRFLFTNAEWFNTDNQVELARLVTANGTPAAQAGGVISSALFGLNFAEFEALSVSVDGRTLTAADDPVTARADTFNVLEGASVSGSVVANDTVPDLIASVALRGAAPTPGTFSLSNAGLMSFDTGTSFEHLAAGRTAMLRFTYQVTDADGDTGDAVVTLRITGTNDLASISGPSTGAITEDSAANVTGRLIVSDVDTGEARFAAPGPLAGIYGTFTFNATTGDWGYRLNNAAANVQALTAGQQVTDTLNVTSLDGTASRAITITVTGANDAASISGSSTGSVAEDGTLITGGTLTVADVDAGQAVFVALAPSALVRTYGTFSFNATSGVWGYTLNNAAANVQALAQGQTVQDTLTVTSLDTMASRTITVSIAGTNDAPVNLGDSNAAANAVLEGAANGSATGVTMRATDPEGSALTYSFKVGGVASAVDGTQRFAIDATTGVITVANGALLNFEAGATQNLTVFARDVLGAETSANVVITLTDRDETPASAVILSFDDVPGGALADGAERPLTSYAGFTFGQAGIYNPNGGLGYTTSSGTTLAFFAEARPGSVVPGYPGNAGDPLVVQRADGTDFDFYSADFSSAFGSTLPVTARAYDDGALVGIVTITVPYGAAPNFDFGDQYPGQRFTSIDRLEFSASDYFGLDDFAFGNVTAIIGGDVTGAITEDAGPISGQLTILDPDPGQAAFATPGVLTGNYGSFTFNAGTGAWGYTLNNAAANVQALREGQTVQDVLNVISLDGTAPKTVTVAVTGANDAAVIGNPTSASVTEDVAPVDGKLSASGTLSIADADQGQASFLTAVTGAAGNLGALTLAANGAYAYSVDNSAVQFLGPVQTKVDSFTVSALDGTTKSISFTIQGTNDPIIIGDPTNASVIEDVAVVDGRLSASGTLSLSDADEGAFPFIVPQVVGPVNTIGWLTLDQNGAYTYSALNGAAQYLGAGESKTESFNFRAADGTPKSISFTVYGANDAPTVRTPLADATASEGQAFTYSFTADRFADVDAGDTLSFSARLANGDALPGWLSFNAATRSFSGTPGFNQAGTLDVRVTATDGSAASVSDVFQIAISDTPTRTPLLVTFEDISTSASNWYVAIPGQYAGFSWPGFSGVFNGPSYEGNPSGYQTGVVSGVNDAWGFFSMEITRDTDFALESGYFTAAWTNGMVVRVSGYDNGILTGGQNMTLSSTGPLLVTFDDAIFDDVDRVRFEVIESGVDNPSFAYDGDFIVMDNLLFGV